MNKHSESSQLLYLIKMLISIKKLSIPIQYHNFIKIIIKWI